MHFTGTRSSHKIILLLKRKAVKLAWRLPNYCNVSSYRNDVINLTQYDESKKKAHNSQIVRAKGNLKLSHCGPSHRQPSSTSPPIKALRQDWLMLVSSS